jgi:chromosome segregation ATPase
MRVYAPLEDPAVIELDQVATKRGISRAQLIIKAIDSYLHQPEPSTEELDQLRINLDQKDSELDQMRIKLDQANNEMDQLKLQLDQTKIKLDQSNTEASNLKDELEQFKTKYNQTTSDATQRWEELKGYKSEVTKLKKLFEESQATNQHLKDDLINRQSETDLLAKTRGDLAVARMEADKLKEAISLRNQDVSFLQGHVAQLTQSIGQLSLKPGEDEIKKKGWSWRFWRS